MTLVWPARALWVVTMLLLTAVLRPAVPDPSIDVSYQVGLFMAFARHLSFGTDLIWTYGPYGWLRSPFLFYLPLAELAVAINLAVQTLFLLMLAMFLTIRQAGVRWWLLFGGLLALLDWTYLDLDAQMIFTAVTLLWAALTWPRPRWATAAAAAGGALLGGACLIRVNNLAVSAAILVIAALFSRRFSLRRMVAVPVGSAILTFLALWLVAGQRLTSIGPYLRSAYELASGYTPAMSRVYPETGRLPLAVGLLLALMIGALVALWRRERGTAFLLLMLVPVAFMTFKEYSVRHYHTGFFIVMVVLLVVVGIDLIRKPGSRGSMPSFWLPAWAGLTGVTVGIVIADVVAPAWLVPRASINATYADAVKTVTSTAFRRVHQDRIIEATRGRYALRDNVVATLREGTVDVMPWDTIVVWAYNFDWDPRPVLQSYSAYTRYLDAADADHLAGRGAPQHILYYYFSGTNGLDNRYQPFDEPATFRTLVSRYHAPQAVQSDHEVLTARPTPLPAERLGTTGPVCVRPGDWIAVPAQPGHFVYAAVDLPNSFRGSVLNLVYKASVPTVTLLHGKGRVESSFRLISRVAENGLFVSGYMNAANDVARILDGAVDDPILAVKVDVPDRRDFSNRVCVRFDAYAAPPG